MPVNTPFDVVLSVNGPVAYAPFAPNQTVTFDGTNTVVAPYALKASTGIRGVVYDDTDSNGNPAAGLPVGGAMAYLDTNDNGVRDAGEPTAVTDAGGAYSFAGLAAGTYTVRVDMTTRRPRHRRPRPTSSRPAPPATRPGPTPATPPTAWPSPPTGRWSSPAWGCSTTTATG